ncbi:MAG: hypothetical protein IJH91_08080 [Mogibacterium sp.]|nr:hypothetical protein [Mogibacterium sp.]
MVKLLVGHKGSGKTKTMINLANRNVEESKGSIIFINKNSRLIYDLSYKIRVICMEDFVHITNEDEYIGFIFGIISSDNDIETIYLDGIMKHADFSLEVLPSFINKIKVISKDYGIDFVISISAELEEMIGVDFNGVEVLN